MNADDPITAIGRDPDAFEAFYREHLDAVQKFIARRVTSPHDAADLTADVFVAAIAASDSYRGDAAAPRAWLFGIARRVVAGHFRSGGRASRAAERVRGQAVIDDDALDGLIRRIDGQRTARLVLQQVRQLPRSQQAVIELVAVDGLSLAEAAAALGITAGNARVRYHRARARLGHPTTTCEASS